jgi:hypothetical protein
MMTGQRVGFLNELDGYRYICIDNLQYREDKLVVFMQTEKFPDEVEHLNGDKADNRWANLKVIASRFKEYPVAEASPPKHEHHISSCGGAGLGTAPEERERMNCSWKSSGAQIADPVQPGEVGPNGYRIEYTLEGDKVEWVPSDDDDEPGTEYPMLLRRNDKAILAAYNEFWGKVWWNRHKRDGTKEQEKLLEQKYGRENLVRSDFEFGLMSGRLSALSWVMGTKWDESLDT